MILGAAVLTGLAAGPALAAPATLTLFAGDRLAGATVAGPALDTSLNDLEGVAVDAAGNMYVPDNAGGHVDKITPDGTLSVIAGSGVGGPPVAGPALNSPLGRVYSLTADPAGNVFITDWSYLVIMKITPDGMLSIVAGDGTYLPTQPGSPTSTSIGGGYALGADDHGNVYFVNEVDGTLWKVAPTGVMSKIAGNGTNGPAVAGPALASPLDFVYGNIAIDAAGSVYLTDGWSKVVKITPDGMLSIIAGTGVSGSPTPGPATSSQLDNPNSIAVDPAGNVYIADAGALVIERVTPDGTLSILAGTGSYQYGQPVTGAPTTVQISPHSIAIDSAGNLVFTSGGDHLLRFGPAEPSAPRNVTAPAADGSAALSFDPPVSPGTTLVSAYQVSMDGGTTWRSLATATGSGGRLTASLTGLSNGTAYQVLVRALNTAGAGLPSMGLAVTPVAPAGPAVITPAPDGPSVTPLAPTTPTAPVLVTPKPTPKAPFLVAVRIHLPASCRTRCVITRATLALRDGVTVLGTRRNLTVTKGGWLRFTIPISKAELVRAPGQHPKTGWRSTLTRLTVAMRGATSGSTTMRKDGHVTINLARLKSGGVPSFPGLR